MRLPALSTTSLPVELERWTQALEAQLTDRSEGYVRVRTPDTDGYLFLHQGRVHCAGLTIGDDKFRAPLVTFFETASSATSVELCTTDLPLFLCTAVLFQKAPSAQLPAELTAIDRALVELAALEQDAVLVVNHGDARTLAFCHRGVPAVLYGPTGEPLRADGAPAARIIAYVGDATRQSSIDIYQDLHVEASDMSGQTISSYVAEGQPREEREAAQWLVVRMQGSIVFQQAIERDETRIGRGSGNDLVLDNLSVSRRHARIKRTSAGLVLEDLGGAGGIKLDGAPVGGSAPLAVGRIFEIGAYTIAVSSQAVSGAVAAPPRPPRPDLRETTRFKAASVLPAQIVYDGGSIQLLEATLDIGRHPDIPVRIKRWLVAPIQLQVVRDGAGHKVRNVAGLRRLRVNGKVVREAKLHDGDSFEIAGASFQYVGPRAE